MYVQRGLNVCSEGLKCMFRGVEMYVQRGWTWLVLKSRLDRICVVRKGFGQFCEGQIIVTGALLRASYFSPGRVLWDPEAWQLSEYKEGDKSKKLLRYINGIHCTS